MELADTTGLGPVAVRYGGSNPPGRTICSTYMDRKGKSFCKDCGMPSVYHVETWFDELMHRFLPSIRLSRTVEHFFDVLLEKFFTFSRLAVLRDGFTRSDIQLRSSCFVEELRKRGATVWALRGPFGYTNHFLAEINGKVVRFESLPTADFASACNTCLVDDKAKTKLCLQEGNFPVAEGKSFWFWQKKRAIEFGIQELGFPLVVKPRGGSIARHVTTSIRNKEALRKAIDKAVAYSPAFIIERFIANSFVYRATVVDFDYVACVKQVPANVVGDGISTIRVLIDRKNNELGRGESHQKEYTLYTIIENETTAKLLSEKGYTIQSVPQKGEIVFLQYDPFLKLGGDLVEVTAEVHLDNLALFKQVARYFDIRVVGIDFLAHNISRSWQEQQCAILELNSATCIELHHFPYSGQPQNVAAALVKLFFKYYL